MTKDGGDPGIDPASIGRSLELFALLKPLVLNDLPLSTDQRLFALLDRFGDPRERSEDRKRKVQRLLLTRDGLLAAYYHRDRIESIERAIITRRSQVGCARIWAD